MKIRRGEERPDPAATWPGAARAASDPAGSGPTRERPGRKRLDPEAARPGEARPGGDLAGSGLAWSGSPRKHGWLSPKASLDCETAAAAMIKAEKEDEAGGPGRVFFKENSRFLVHGSAGIVSGAQILGGVRFVK